MIEKIIKKWGFGMAPEKTTTINKRNFAIKYVIDLIDNQKIRKDFTVNSLSEVKGMFMRVVKQDQWDWFVTFERLGRPSIIISKKIGNQLKLLRDIISQKSSLNIKEEIEKIKEMKIKKYLTIYLNNETISLKTPQIYILSTRNHPDILKIGFTNRSVTERVNEINGSTGVLVPYGVRAAWRIKDAEKIEKEIHNLFAEYRIRSDREFFNIKFEKAFVIINKFLREKRLEIN